MRQLAARAAPHEHLLRSKLFDVKRERERGRTRERKSERAGHQESERVGKYSFVQVR